MAPASAGAVGEVQEIPAAIDDRLIERQAARPQDGQEPLRPREAIAVDRLAQRVLAVGDAADKGVHLRRAVAAQDGDRFAQPLAQRVEQPLHQLGEVVAFRRAGPVREAVLDRRPAVCQFVKRKISHVCSVSFPVFVIDAEKRAREGAHLAEGDQHGVVDLALGRYPEAHEEQGESRQAERHGGYQLYFHLIKKEEEVSGFPQVFQDQRHLPGREEPLPFRQPRLGERVRQIVVQGDPPPQLRGGGPWRAGGEVKPRQLFHAVTTHAPRSLV